MSDIPVTMIPATADYARRLVQAGALRSKTRALETVELMQREGLHNHQILAIFDIGFAMARLTNSVLMAAAAPYGAALKAEKRIYGQSAPETIAAALEENRDFEEEGKGLPAAENDNFSEPFEAPIDSELAAAIRKLRHDPEPASSGLDAYPERVSPDYVEDEPAPSYEDRRARAAARRERLGWNRFSA